jgi:hypothetical protein
MHNMLRRDPAILPGAGHRGDRLLADGERTLTGKMNRERIETMLSDDWRRNAENFREPKLSRNLDLVEKLRENGLATTLARRGCHRLDLEVSGRDRRDRRRTQAGSGGRRGRRGGSGAER